MNTGRIIEVLNQPEIAKINRVTGDIFVSSNIWHQLPEDEKEFVLLHERGHLEKQTPDEYAANAYAIENFAPAGELNNQQLGKKIMVMRSILDKADDNFSNFTFQDIGAGIGSVFQNLSVLGIGSKGRAREAAASVQLINAQAANNAEKAKQTTKLVVIAGAFLLVITVLILTLKK